jgi:predicted dehydrogenase
MVDLLVDLAGAPARSVYALAPHSTTGDDVTLSLGFPDGSTATLVYASGGDRSLPKERLEVLGDGMAVVLDDFRRLIVHAGGREQRIGGRLATQDKGHGAELSAFLSAARTGGLSPVDPEHAAHVTRVTFAAAESARTGQPVHI